jgi:hypothetical protein
MIMAASLSAQNAFQRARCISELCVDAEAADRGSDGHGSDALDTGSLPGGPGRDVSGHHDAFQAQICTEFALSGRPDHDASRRWR